MKWKKQLIHGGILAGIFFLAVFVFSYITNKENSDMTADMGTASRPGVSFAYDGYGLNHVPVYKKKMDITSVRDTVTPVRNGNLTMNLKMYDDPVTKIRYRVYTLDGEEVLLEKNAGAPKENVVLKFDDPQILNEEKVLEVILDFESGADAYLYTRILDSDGLNVLESLDYIRAFHENALDKVEGAGIGKAIEPNEEGDNTTLQHVTIHSDYDHVTWGDLEPKVEGGERWNIKEINPSSISVMLEYRVRGKGEENEDDIYYVKEYFRVRHVAAGNQTYLLDYDRTMDQIFDASRQILNEKGLLLGITDPDIPYLVNEDGTIVSFVQGKEVWNYNKNVDEISLVFSFSDAENTDIRNFLSQHEVELLEMDEKGNTTFAVYGYMNRGDHEGETGAAVYYYNIEKNTVEEKVFVSTDKGYGWTAKELSKLIYYNVDKDILYILADGSLYEVDVRSGWKEELVTGLSDDQYVVAEDGHLAAYQTTGESGESDGITVRDFAAGEERKIVAEEGETIHPLGFIKNDFVYGTARTADSGKTVSGQDVIPMYKIEIENSKGKNVKTYEQEGFYTLSADFEDDMITLNRVQREGDAYAGAPEDYITNNEEKDESNIYVETYTTELKERQVRIIYADGIPDKNPKLLKPKQVLRESPEDIVLDYDDTKEQYYVYGYGELQAICDTAGEAIQKAGPYNGTVVSERQSYVWVQGNRDQKHRISEDSGEINMICEALRNGETPVAVTDRISDGKSIDLTGCTSEQLLYIINQDIPVIGMLDANRPILLVGYGEGTVTYIDVADGERRTASFKEMDDMTGGGGHTYVAYVR